MVHYNRWSRPRDINTWKVQRMISLHALEAKQFNDCLILMFKYICIFGWYFIIQIYNTS